MAWILCGTGVLFCFSGVCFFYKKVFEKTGSIIWPLIIMILGVILIGIGTSIYFHL